MVALVLEKPDHKTLVIGPIYNKIDKLKSVKDLFPNYDFIIFNGGLCYPYDNLKEVETRIHIMNEYLQSKKVFYNLGNYDLELLKSLEESNKFPQIAKWLQQQSNVIIINSQQSLIVTCGGLTPQMNKKDLFNNWETSFVSNINNMPWHKSYGGSYGYVISNNPLTNGPPQFYNFSAQIGNAYNENTQVYAQEVERLGLKKTILL